jgi:hypothetical protein
VDRLLTKIQGVPVSDEEWMALYMLLSRVYTYLDLPERGSLPPHDPVWSGLIGVHLALPCLDKLVLKNHWLDVVHESSTWSTLRLPETEYDGREGTYHGKITDLVPRSVVEVFQQKASGYLEKMGFIKVSAMYKFVPYNLDNWSLYRESIAPPFKRRFDRLYRVEIPRDLPYWWDQIDDQRYFYVDIDDIEDE